MITREQFDSIQVDSTLNLTFRFEDKKGKVQESTVNAVVVDGINLEDRLLHIVSEIDGVPYDVYEDEIVSFELNTDMEVFVIWFSYADQYTSNSGVVGVYDSAEKAFANLSSSYCRVYETKVNRGFTPDKMEVVERDSV